MLSKTISTSRSASFLVNSAARATSSTSSAFVITISRYSCKKDHSLCGRKALKGQRDFARTQKSEGYWSERTVAEKGSPPQDKLCAAKRLGKSRIQKSGVRIQNKRKNVFPPYPLLASLF